MRESEPGAARRVRDGGAGDHNRAAQGRGRQNHPGGTARGGLGAGRRSRRGARHRSAGEPLGLGRAAPRPVRRDRLRFCRTARLARRIMDRRSGSAGRFRADRQPAASRARGPRRGACGGAGAGPGAALAARSVGDRGNPGDGARRAAASAGRAEPRGAAFDRHRAHRRGAFADGAGDRDRPDRQPRCPGAGDGAGSAACSRPRPRAPPPPRSPLLPRKSASHNPAMAKGRCR